MSSDIKLLPCPFCGGEARTDSCGSHWVRCTICGARGCVESTRKEAIEQWNIRKPMDRIVEQLEEKKKEYLDGFSTHKENELYGVACGFGDSIKIIKAGGKV